MRSEGERSTRRAEALGRDSLAFTLHQDSPRDRDRRRGKPVETILKHIKLTATHYHPHANSFAFFETVPDRRDVPFLPLLEGCCLN